MSGASAVLNELGMPVHRKVGGGRGRPTGATRQEREIRVAFHRRVAESVCCVSAYQMETVTTAFRATIFEHTGVWLPYRCQRLCDAYVAVRAATERAIELNGGYPLPLPASGGGG